MRQGQILAEGEGPLKYAVLQVRQEAGEQVELLHE